MEEYLEKLVSQIRCVKARPFVKKEIQDHLEDQIEANRQSGMSGEEAEQAAVLEMGDPVEVGTQLDRIHRPTVSWDVILIISLISIFGCILQRVILRQVLEVQGADGLVWNVGSSYTSTVLIGLGLMLLVYLLDYTFLGKNPRLLIVLLLVVSVLGRIFLGIQVSGGYYIGIGRFTMSLSALSFLYLPIFGAILFEFRGQEAIGLLKALVWMVIPLGQTTFLCYNLTLSIILLLSMLGQVQGAINRGWFCKKKKRVLLSIAVWGWLLGFPTLLFVFRLLTGTLPGYQAARIIGFFDGTGTSSYMTQILRQIHQDGVMVGGDYEQMLKILPAYSSDYVLSYVTGTFGRVAAFGMVALMVVLFAAILLRLLKQKNELGTVVGLGCFNVLFLLFLLNVLGNMGWIPLTNAFLPFWGAGNSGILISYLLVGVILSICKFRTVYPKEITLRDKRKGGHFPGFLSLVTGGIGLSDEDEYRAEEDSYRTMGEADFFRTTGEADSYRMTGEAEKNGGGLIARILRNMELEEIDEVDEQDETD